MGFRTYRCWQPTQRGRGEVNNVVVLVFFLPCSTSRTKYWGGTEVSCMTDSYTRDRGLSVPKKKIRVVTDRHLDPFSFALVPYHQFMDTKVGPMEPNYESSRGTNWHIQDRLTYCRGTELKESTSYPYNYYRRWGTSVPLLPDSRTVYLQSNIIKGLQGLVSVSL